MKNFLPVFLFALFKVSVILSDTQVLRPRGVPLTKAALYDGSKPFTCFDGSNQIPFAYINDDFCDCHDASDEPGTSACAQGFFHCTNRGYRSIDIPSGRVNDGICDCCDGSDEYDETKVSCSNTCLEMGKAMREEAERQRELMRSGFKKRQEMIDSVKNRKAEKTAAFANLELQVKDLEPQKEQLQKEKEAAEELEKVAKDKHRDAWEAFKKERDETRERAAAEESFKFFSPDQSPLTAEGLLSKLVKEGENLSDDLQQFIKGLSNVDFESYLTSVWPKIKDTYKSVQASLSEATTASPVVPTEVAPEAEKDDHLMDPYDEEEREAEDDHAYHPEDSAALSPDEDKMPDYSPETRQLIDTAEKARKDFTEFDLRVFKLNEEKTAIKKWLDNDYGPDFVFAALEDTCHEYTDREYTYKLCPFDRVTQKSKDGGSETGLGKWGNWENGYKEMKYTDGARCWNGPARSTKVILECGGENQLISASEPNRCEYQMTFRTPAVCTEPTQNGTEHLGLHDEL
ncbi:glucosidase 2 subunit beta-like [Paramacrobiotus metropolitanus]|uniref:glucosidase 2 subunit beta-like n=1 Tax=Paramacrobiotus metropolitanus TaxID=2943436 RepID=UPI002445FCD4|nr:glucosidase 2 subunit beta-like [Paramacrobiotus metropolitanus]